MGWVNMSSLASLKNINRNGYVIGCLSVLVRQQVGLGRNALSCCLGALKAIGQHEADLFVMSLLGSCDCPVFVLFCRTYCCQCCPESRFLHPLGWHTVMLVK